MSGRNQGVIAFKVRDSFLQMEWPSSITFITQGLPVKYAFFCITRQITEKWEVTSDNQYQPLYTNQHPDPENVSKCMKYANNPLFTAALVEYLIFFKMKLILLDIPNLPLNK